MISKNKSEVPVCEKKKEEVLRRRVIVTSTFLSDGAGQYLNISAVYNDLISAFEAENLIALEFEESNLEIFLYGKDPHLILPSMLADKADLNFFRRLKINITLGPLECSKFNITKCLESTAPALILVKTSAFHIFTSGDLLIRNVEIRGSDIFFANRVDYYQFQCLNNSNACCSEEAKANSNLIAGACSLTGFRFSAAEEILENNFPLFNLELIEDDPAPYIPKLFIENCVFYDFQAFTKGFRGIARAVTSEPFGLFLYNVSFRDCFLADGIFVAKSAENNFNRGKFIISIQVLKILNYNQYNLTNIENFDRGLFHFENLELTIIMRNLALINIKPNNQHFSFLAVKSPVNSESLVVLEEISISNLKEFPICYTISSFVRITSLIITESLLFDYSIDIWRTDLELQSLLIANSSVNKESFVQVPFILSTQCYLALKNVTLINDKSIDFEFEFSVISVDGLEVLSTTVEINLINLYSCVSEFKNVSVKSFSGKFSFYNILKGFFSEYDGFHDGVELFSFYEADNVEAFSSINCVFINLRISYITSPGRLYSKLVFSNSSFLNSTYEIFFSFYVSTDTENMLIFDRCSFSNLNIKYILFELCCTNFQLLNSALENIIMSKEGQYLFCFESSKNYSVENSRFINAGFNDIENIDWLKASLTYYSGGMLWYGDALKIVNVYCVLDEKFFYPTGFFGADGAKYYVFIENYTIISRSPFEKRLVRGLYVIKTPNVSLINSRFFGLGCPFNQPSLPFSYYNGIISIINHANFGGDGLNNFSVRIENVSIDRCQCKYGGGLSIVNYNKILLFNIGVKNTFASSRGGALLISSSNSALISNLTIDNTTSDEGSYFYLENIKSCDLRRISLANGRAILAAGVFISMLKNLSIFDLSLVNSTGGEKGGGLYVEQSVISLFNSTFINTSAQYAGAIFLAPLTFAKIKNITSLFGIATEEGGIFYCSDASEITLASINIFYSLALQSAGALYINNYKTLFISSLYIEESYTNGDATILVKSLLEESKTLLENVSCLKCVSDKGACLFIDVISPVYLKSLRAKHNKGFSVLEMPFPSSMSVSIEKMRVSDCFVQRVMSGLNLELFLNDGVLENCFVEREFFLLYDSSIKITSLDCIPITALANNVIFNGLIREYAYLFDVSVEGGSQSLLSLRGGSIFLNNLTVANANLPANSNLIAVQLSKILVISNSRIKRIAANSLINITNSDLEIFNCEITQAGFANSTLIDILNNKNNFLSSKISFSNCTFAVSTGIAVKGRFFESLSVNACFFIGDGNNLFSDSNSFLSLTDILSITINETVFNCSSAKRGSALFYRDDFLFKITTKLNIVQSIFEYLRALYGGAIYVEGKFIISLERTKMNNNRALFVFNENSGVGGAAYLNCTISENCLCFVSELEFSNNEAELFAPCIFSSGGEVSLSKGRSINFSNNTDIMNYTRELGSTPRCIAIDNESEDYSCIDENTVLDIESGVPFDLNFVVIDDYGDAAIFDNKSTINLKSNSSNVSLYFPQHSQNVIKGRKTFYSVNVKTIPDVKSLIYLELFVHSPAALSSSYTIQRLSIRSKNCPIGSIIKFDMTCEACEKNTYSLDDPGAFYHKGKRITCKKCPENFICFGQNNIFPNHGYYRLAKNSLRAIRCQGSGAACLGFAVDASGKPHSLECLENHGGNLCYKCAAGYGRFRRGGFCENCERARPYFLPRMIIMILILLVYVIVNSYLFTRKFRSQIKNNKDDQIVSPFIVFKILFNHLQSLSVLNVAISDYPFIEDLTNLQSYFAILNEDILSLECLIDNKFKKEYIFILKVIGMVLLPILVGVIVCVFWFLQFIASAVFLKNNTRSIKDTLKKILASFTIATYMLYPSIIQSVFALSNCIENTLDTESEYFLLVNPDLKCWQGDHLIYFLTVFLPAALIWGICFPVFLFFLLRLSYLTDISNNLNKSPSIFFSQEISIFRFFYEDYKNSCFYWEIVIFLKKFLLNVLISLSEVIGSGLNNLLKILLLILYAQLVISARPFSLKTCNLFETSSSAIIVISINVLVLGDSQVLKNYRAALLLILVAVNSAWIGFIILYFFRLVYIKKRDSDARRRSAKVLIRRSLNFKSGILKK